MRLVKIKNKYLFNSNKPNGYHYYATYYDRKNKRYNAVQLTHLYVKDSTRFNQVSKGNIMVMKFNGFDVPSGVRNQYYFKDVNGQNICLKNKNVLHVSKNHLKKKQSDKIRLFAKKPHK